MEHQFHRKTIRNINKLKNVVSSSTKTKKIIYHNNLNRFPKLKISKLQKIQIMSSIQIRVHGRYRLEDKLYEGKNSSVYTGRNVQSETDCAIKCESKNINPSFVFNEGKILQNIQGGVGIPNLLWYGENGDFNFLVTELMGNSLEDYLQICGGKFSLKTVLMIAEKVISSIQFIHYKNYLHRDIKPQNFLMGLGAKLHQIYTIDFAYATTYFNPNIKSHRPDDVDEERFIGTLRYSSLNVIQGHKNSRRDDLQSIGLMLVYLLKGSLPWQGCLATDVKSKKKQIRKIMEKTTLAELCQGIPKEFQIYLEYCRKLKYQDTPDYGFLKRLFKQKFIKEGYLYDHIYDWILIPLRLKDPISKKIPLNKQTKKQSDLLSMVNCCKYDFLTDFNFDNEIQKTIKIEEKKQTQEKKLKQIKDTRKRAGSEIKPAKPKKGKQDCIIY